jgi:hypothetical protein
MKMKRKILALFLAMVLAMPLFVITTQAQVGQRAGDVLNTDIRVFLNGAPIMGYNIAGWTYIVAEDLVYYGLDVLWNPTARTLSIARGQPRAVTPRFIPENFAPVGSVAFPFVYTDIVTYIAGNRVTSYNIQGSTVVRIDDVVTAFGQSQWDSVRRELLASTDGQPPRRPARAVPLFTRPYIDVGNAAWFHAGGNEQNNFIRLFSGFLTFGGVRNNHVIYQLDGVAQYLRAILSVPPNGVVIYRIYGDGRLLFVSPSLGTGGIAVPVDLDIRGVHQLRIEKESTTWDLTNLTSSWGIMDAVIITSE